MMGEINVRILVDNEVLMQVKKLVCFGRYLTKFYKTCYICFILNKCILYTKNSIAKGSLP